MELIKITEKNGKKAVSARELHILLGGNPDNLNTWFKSQADRAMLVENVDYVGCKEINALANKELNDYAVSVSGAKDIAMLNGGERSKRVRTYLIEREKYLQIPMIEKINKFREYLDYIEEHYNNVQKAWSLINEKCKDRNFRFMVDEFAWDTIDAEVKNHDFSKLSAEEFTQYRQFIFPCKGEKRGEDAFNEAYKHHIKQNEHHFETWTEKHKDNSYADAFLVINIVEWVAVGFKCNTTAKQYYERNAKHINLPDWAVTFVYEVFHCIYN